MKKLKYRIWLKKEKKMYEEDFHLAFDRNGDFEGVEIMVDGPLVERCECCGPEPVEIYDDLDDPDNIVVMQYAGIDDLNGTPIYEGDVVYFKNKSPFKSTCEDKSIGLREVVFTNGSFRIKGIGPYTTSHISGKNFVVVGNIYKNPHLLKENS